MGELPFVDFAFCAPFVNAVLKKGKGKMAPRPKDPEVRE
jgi:hypothetical protein